MKVETKLGYQTKVLDGNRAAAYGVMLCQPDVICAYPITPQSEILEQLYLFQAQGLLDAQMVEVESEHSAMGALRGASAAGARTFTATAAQGLAFMFENCINVATTRLPIVMVNVCRQMIAPHVINCSHEDIMMAKEMGWIQIHSDTCQEIVDSVIMAYRLAEDPEIRIPVVVCHDGYFLSHLWEPVEIPPVEKAQGFLQPLTMSPKIDPRVSVTLGPAVPGEMGTKLRYTQSVAIQRAKEKFDQIDEEFEEVFGRSHGGQLEEYRMEDADLVIIAMGSCVGTAKVAVDRKREEGIKIGLIKIRMFRPFPCEKLASAIRGRKGVGVLDRSISLGWGLGHIFVELKAALQTSNVDMPILDFICGLSNMDITIESLERIIDMMSEAVRGGSYKEVTWIDLE